MKIKSFLLFAIIGVIIIELIILLIVQRPHESEISQLNNQNQISVPESYMAAPISKGTILLLLAAGVIGVLGVSRKKKDSGSQAQNNEIPQAAGHHNLNEDK
jgi:preprotein translocase subunit SecG